MTGSILHPRPPDPPFHTGEPSPAVAAVMAALEGIRNPHGRFPLLREQAEAAVAALPGDLVDAWNALPDSVTGDAAPASATLGERIRAVVMERDQARNAAHRCHARHMALEHPAPIETRPSCVCPVGGYSIECHRGDHRQNAAAGMTDR